MESNQIEPKNLNVGELIDILKQFPSDLIVNIYFEYQDRDGYTGANGSKIGIDAYGKYLDLNSRED